MLFLLLYSACAISNAIELSSVSDETVINEHLHIQQGPSSALPFSLALQEFQQKKIKPTDEKKRISFGFVEDITWASIAINNTSKKPVDKLFYIDSAWLDHADFYFVFNKKLVAQNYNGDALPFESRKIKHRMITQPHTFQPGITHVLIRFESKDPLIVPIYLTTEAVVQDNLTFSNYFYGFIYGVFFILIIYNIVLFISLKEASYVLYFFYLLSFLSLNIVYTGHGFKYFWPENTFLQQWLMPLLAFCYFIFGIAFSIEFLKMKAYAPKLYHYKSVIYGGLIFIGTSLLFNGDRILILKVTLAISSLLGLIFIVLGGIALKNGSSMVKFFIPAIIMGAGGAAVSSAATWGAIPYTSLFFHSVELGMLIEMSILALALGYNLKQKDTARIIAEVNAQMDYLTGLFNRRAFIASATLLWNLGVRNNQPFSMILLDIDWFKKINDEYGHEAGDVALKLIASTIQHSVRKSDVLARWGGEEFIIFLPNTPLCSTTKLAEAIREKIEAVRLTYADKDINITASFGVATYDAQITSLDMLIKLADTALYKAKQNGRNTVYDMG